jgi:hypothetical protein
VPSAPQKAEAPTDPAPAPLLVQGPSDGAPAASGGLLGQRLAQLAALKAFRASPPEAEPQEATPEPEPKEEIKTAEAPDVAEIKPAEPEEPSADEPSQTGPKPAWAIKVDVEDPYQVAFEFLANQLHPGILRRSAA